MGLRSIEKRSEFHGRPRSYLSGPTCVDVSREKNKKLVCPILTNVSWRKTGKHKTNVPGFREHLRGEGSALVWFSPFPSEDQVGKHLLVPAE